ncbi:MAG: hypothetical protein JO065_16760 [Acidobacteria bacterium]|nr:hypothetical protein [Acidobacteriota bacterium]
MPTNVESSPVFESISSSTASSNIPKDSPRGPLSSTHAFLRLVRIAFVLSSVLPLVVLCCSAMIGSEQQNLRLQISMAALLAVVANALFRLLFKKLEGPIDRLAQEQAWAADQIPERFLEIAITGSAALSLLLELAVIRWQGTVWELFAFYKNLGLLACFAGLGLGYALAKSERIHLALSAPLLAFQMALLIALRHSLNFYSMASLRIMPVREQLNMGLGQATSFSQYVAVYFFLSVVFLLTALMFVPVGQLCGRMLLRTEQLRAYRLNLLGSLLGVVLMLALSFLWTPPVIWFAICLFALLMFQLFQRRAFLTAAITSFVALIVLAWPVSTGSELIYSPYQLLERGVGESGQMVLRAAGHYYQHVYDLSIPSQQSSTYLHHLGVYYEFPYRLRTPVGSVAIVGAGTGNDVAAALRAGAAHVDAVEIDPAIQALGMDHPERPFSDQRVHMINDDARSFLRGTHGHYDLIDYGLLDSHTLLSQNSSLRLDSYVYTVEALREARARLADDGILSLSFSVMSREMGHKIYLMMQQAFDGHAPICVLAGYDNSVIFLQSKDGNLTLPAGYLQATGFRDVTQAAANPAIRADIATDDWPFFYMPQRVYPISYVFLIALVLALSLLIFGNFLPERPRLSHAAFFFLGAGFMLIETKAITEMGLAFGNTWQVIGIVIAGVLFMAYLANSAVQAFGLRRTLIPYLLLLAAMGIGLAVAKSGGFAPTVAGRLLTIVILTCPIFFAGIVFSTLISRTENIAGAMASNLFGAMVGGVLEYNSMYFGFHFLYWLAAGLYLAAFVSSLTKARTRAAQ